MRPEDVLDLQSVAALVGITKATAQNYRHLGMLPEPAGYVSNSPWWQRQAIEAWKVLPRPKPPKVRQS